MRKALWPKVALALALAACSAPSNEARAVFDQLLKHPESRSLGIAVSAGSENRVFDCYAKKIEASGSHLSTVTATLKAFLEERDFKALSKKEQTQATLNLLLALSTVAECQGGLPTR